MKVIILIIEKNSLHHFSGIFYNVWFSPFNMVFLATHDGDTVSYTVVLLLKG